MTQGPEGRRVEAIGQVTHCVVQEMRNFDLLCKQVERLAPDGAVQYAEIARATGAAMLAEVQRRLRQGPSS
jgi:hypothetical protein